MSRPLFLVLIAVLGAAYVMSSFDKAHPSAPAIVFVTPTVAPTSAPNNDSFIVYSERDVDAMPIECLRAIARYWFHENLSDRPKYIAKSRQACPQLLKSADQISLMPGQSNHIEAF